LNLEATVLDEILAVENLPLGEARDYLGAFLFSGDDVFKPIGALSGGERSRVALAKLVLTGANFFILDEPTNHLDIPSQENLESVLNRFEGTVLLVSHDRYFVDALATHVWALEPETGAVTVLKGGYSAYLAYQEASKSQFSANGTAQDVAKTKSQLEREQTKAEKRAAEKRAREIAEIESLIDTKEAELAQLAQKLEDASLAQDVVQIQKLGQVYQAAELELEQLLSRWTDMEMVEG
jgi:ATP-binding cassette subfamily F protein 3